jgi:hypothetical protein
MAVAAEGIIVESYIRAGVVKCMAHTSRVPRLYMMDKSKVISHM